MFSLFGRKRKAAEEEAARRRKAAELLAQSAASRTTSSPTAKSSSNAVAQAKAAELEKSGGKADDPRRRRRPGAGKTRLMGFDTSDGRVVDLFEDENVEKAQHGRCAFPVAWIVVAEGPGRGECFALMNGMSQIGRGEDQAVRLDFGDMAVSRSNHAAIVYDPEAFTFLLGHGGKANLVRMNGKPLVTTEPLSDGDTIEIGETKLVFKSLCSEKFNWEEIEDQGDDDDVEIA